MQKLTHTLALFSLTASLITAGVSFATPSLAISPTGQLPTEEPIQETKNPFQVNTIVPDPNVPIPGLEYGTLTLNKKTNGLLVPYIGQYVSAVYKFLVGASVIAAAIMITYGGFLYIVKGTAKSVSDGKTYIVDACLGLFLVISAYTILGIVSPTTTSLKPIEVTVIQKDILADWLDQNGTTYLTRPIPTDAELGKPSQENPTVTTNNPSFKIDPETGAPPTPINRSVPPPPTNKLNVDVSSISFDRSLGGAGNIGQYCTGPSTSKSADTYEKKQDLLAKSVLGFYTTCIKNKLCVYSQATVSSIPSGKLGKGAPATNYAAAALISRTGMTPETIWPDLPQCAEAYQKKPSSTIGMTECKDRAAELYNEKINAKIEEAKAFASDCVAFVMSIYQCANAKQKFWGKALVDAVTAMATHRSPSQDFINQPQIVFFGAIGTSIEEIEKQANLKGGVKFGDIFFVSGGSGQNAMHYYLYTGGRSDIPFSFIEMGGAGPGMNIPGVGYIGGANIKTVTWQDDVQNKLKTSLIYPWYCPQAGCTQKGRGSQCYKSCSEKDQIVKKASYAADGTLMIYRPYAE